MWSNFYFLVQVRFDDSLSKNQKWKINLHDLLGCFKLLQAHLGFSSAHSICLNVESPRTTLSYYCIVHYGYVWVQQL